MSHEHLNAGIILKVYLSRCISIPIAARLLKDRSICHRDRNLALGFHELHGQALGCVPRDMAM